MSIIFFFLETVTVFFLLANQMTVELKFAITGHQLMTCFVAVTVVTVTA